MKLSKTEIELRNEIRNLEKPYSISYGKLKTAASNKFSCEDVLQQIKDKDEKYRKESSLGGKYKYLDEKYRQEPTELEYKQRLSAIAQLFATDMDDHKLFIEKEESEGLDTEIVIGGKIYDCPYVSPVIPTETIQYYSKTFNYTYAPITSMQLYNNIIRHAAPYISQHFLGKLLTDKNLDIALLFGNDVLEHLKKNHISTEYEKVARVISEQKPGTSMVTIKIPTPDEYIKETGKEFVEDEYYDYINKIFIDAENGISTDRLNNYIRETILENLDTILFWHKTDDHEIFEKEGGDANEISVKFDIRNSPEFANEECIGTGYDLSLREKSTYVLKIPIRKDKFSPLGINAKTLYPDILDKSATFTGKVFDKEEAIEIGRRVAIDNTIEKRTGQKTRNTIELASENLGRELTPSEKDTIRNSDFVKLTDEEINNIVKRVNETYTGIDYFESPVYKAFAKAKEDATDKKIVMFFGNFHNKHRIEITPETFANRLNHDFHRCVIIYDFDKDVLKTAFFQTERAAGFDGSMKISFDDLKDDEKKLFNGYIKSVKECINEFRKENGLKTKEEVLVDKILNDDMNDINEFIDDDTEKEEYIDDKSIDNKQYCK